MKRLEETALMIVIDNPGLVPVLLENITPIDILENQDNQKIFRAISSIHKDGKLPLLPIIIERCQGIKSRHWQKLSESIEGVPYGQRERFLLETISTLKWTRNKNLILKQIQHEVENPLGNPREVIKLANQLKVVGMEKEDPSYAVANEEYKAWITTEGAGIELGYPALDYAIDSFNLDELCVICGRPTTGKTMLAFNCIQHQLRTTPRKIGLFSLEMPKAAVVERQKQIFFGLSRHELKEVEKNGTVRDEELMATYQDLLLFTRNYSVSEIAKIIEDNHIEIVFIDFMNIIKTETRGGRYEQTTQVILDLKRMAKDLGCLVFVLAQLSRLAGNGSNRVSMDMIRDSGAIEEVADFILGLCRPDISADADAERKDTVEVGLLKNKRGQTTRCNIYKDPRTGRMRERAT